MKMKGEWCESAKRGYCCIDDICRGSDITLCGFDRQFYEEEIRRDDDFDDYCPHGVSFCDDCEDCEEEEEDLLL